MSTNHTIADYVRFLMERQQVWQRKDMDKQEWPWTEDTVLRRGKFCNIYRELDTVSRYEMKQLTGVPAEDVYAICLLRHSNSPATYEALRDGRDTELTEVPCSDSLVDKSNLPGRDMREFVRLFRDQLQSQLSVLLTRLAIAETAEGAWAAVRDTLRPSVYPDRELFPGFDAFWAYEIYTSLTYCSWFPWTEDDFVLIGPGCQPALDRLCGPKSGQYEFDALLPIVKKRLMLDPGYVWIPPECQPKAPEPYKFTKRTLEHSLCEWRKYFQIAEGRTSRRPYPQPVTV